MFQCNETGRLFEKAVLVMDEDCGQEDVSKKAPTEKGTPSGRDWHKPI